MHFSENVREALGTVLPGPAADPSRAVAELRLSFEGVTRVEVPAERSVAA